MTDQKIKAIVKEFLHIDVEVKRDKGKWLVHGEKRIEIYPESNRDMLIAIIPMLRDALCALALACLFLLPQSAVAAPRQGAVVRDPTGKIVDTTKVERGKVVKRDATGKVKETATIEGGQIVRRDAKGKILTTQKINGR